MRKTASMILVTGLLAGWLVLRHPAHDHGEHGSRDGGRGCRRGWGRRTRWWRACAAIGAGVGGVVGAGTGYAWGSHVEQKSRISRQEDYVNALLASARETQEQTAIQRHPSRRISNALTARRRGLCNSISNGALPEALSREAVKKRRQNSPRRNSNSSAWRPKSRSNNAPARTRPGTYDAHPKPYARYARRNQATSNGRETCWNPVQTLTSINARLAV